MVKEIKKNTEAETEEIQKLSPKKQKEENNKTLLQIFIIVGLVFLAFFSVYFYLESKKSFEYEGVKFTQVQEGEMIFYNTQIPVYNERGDQIYIYNFYLRTDPRELAKLEFNGIVDPMQFVALNYSSEIDCDGYGIIALTNIINLYTLIGSKVVVDKNATCELGENYMFLNVQKTNESRIEKIGTNCYNIKVKECEVFPATERFMLETFAKMKADEIIVISPGYVAE